MPPLVEVADLSFRYTRSSWALQDINLTIKGGSTLGIVGESGSGKSTLVRILCGLLGHGTGSVTYDGREVGDWLASDRRRFRRENQIVFQSPASSLDPRMRVARSLAEPVRALERRKVSADELETWLGTVGLGGTMLTRYPHQLSGGQLQRVAIARAISVGPRILYADEPTSALDVSVQAQVLNLLMELRHRLGLTMVMVSHDLAVVSRVCEQVVVMRHGRIVDHGATADVLERPSSRYTAALTAAARAVALPTV